MSESREIKTEPDAAQEAIQKLLTGDPHRDQYLEKRVREIMRDKKVLGVFDAGYGGISSIEVMNGFCEVCQKDKIIVTWDGSGGEYGTGAICSDCFSEGIERNREELEKSKKSD